jgi:TfoX N-terminal domain
MAYDQQLAARVREQLRDEETLAEREMFGGIAFMLSGHMSVGVSGEELIVRVGPGGAEDALKQPHVRPFEGTGRPMKGWVVVAPPGLSADGELGTWVSRGARFARSLPPKS